MAESSRKRRTSVGVLFWIAFILLVLVIFLANRSNIEQVLESTGIVEVVRERFAGGTGEDGAFDDAAEPTEPDTGSEDEPRVVIGEPETRRRESPAATDPVEETSAPESDEGESGGTAQSDSAVEAPEVEAPPAARETPQDEPPRSTGVAQREPSPDPQRPNRVMTGLYFIKVTDDGRTFPQRVVRPVYYASSPLTETIRTLISGPSGDELDDGLLNLIPDGTELISAHVTDGVAFLNFNQSFRFNPLGAEGTVAQLLQIIYSSTEFPTVQRVQFLVEGERVDYLGGDGIYVGEPLARDAFSS